MTIPSRDELRSLARHQDERCLSIFMPTHKVGSASQEDPIRFKNIIRQAEEQLVANGARGTQAREMLQPASDLLGDPFFWQHQGDGLVLYVSPGLFRYYQLPLVLPEYVTVADHFDIQPLFPLFVNDGTFYVLALSQNTVKLYQCTRDTIHEVPLDGVPKSLAEALATDQREEHLQFHTETGPSGTGERAAVFYGSGAFGGESTKDQVLRFTHLVDKGLHSYLRDEQGPLVLAAVDYLLPIYKDANTYPHLAAEAIEGNPEGAHPQDLHRRAWGIVRPQFLQRQKDTFEQYWNLAGTGRTANDVREVAPAAYNGRVAALFAAAGARQWGRYDPADNTVRMNDGAEPGLEDLVSFSVLHTFLNSGSVFTVPASDMPDNTAVAAVLRY